ncbi:MAG: enoyl-CoA hydratase/isomerase family protein [Chloroflexi bacterium]|nr:enoyl-CoA hydratase/isomerase family protein [Chloroflexota bacterium]
MPYETLLYRKEGSLAVITLNRPDRLNALSRQLWQDMNAVLDEIEGDGEVRVVILHGNGRAFCAGADIRERVDTEAATPPLARATSAVFTKLENLSKVTIAAIHGFALGGGCELAMACDLRIAAEGSQFGQPEVKLGILPGAGGTQRLPRLIGSGRAKELMYVGDFIPASTAFQWGLVNRVVPADRLLDEARAFANVLLERPPLALRLIKSCVQVGLQTDLHSGLEYEARCSYILNTSEDRKEGMRAFVEKRKPVFHGR